VSLRRSAFVLLHLEEHVTLSPPFLLVTVTIFDHSGRAAGDEGIPGRRGVFAFAGNSKL